MREIKTDTLSADFCKFVDNFPFDQDITLQILKGHLLIEEIFRETFDLHLCNKLALNGNNGTSFSCHQVICLVEALLPENKEMKWVWSAAKKFNAIRNQMAHNLKPEGVEEKIEKLFAIVNESFKSSEAIIGPNIDKRDKYGLVAITLHICSTVSSLKVILEENK